MRIRPYRPDDEDAVIELMAEQRDFHEAPADRAVLRLDHRLQLVATQDERVAAYGALLCPPWFDRSQLSATVVVTIGRRNEGYGGAMWQQILMSTGSATTVHGSVVVGDERSLAIARHWGLSVYQTPITSVITFDRRPAPVALRRDSGSSTSMTSGISAAAISIDCSSRQIRRRKRARPGRTAWTGSTRYRRP